MEEFRTQMFAGSEGVDREAVREKVRQIRRETETQIRDLLTEDQYTAFQEMDRMRRGPGGRGR
jgi:hypothetical protein